MPLTVATPEVGAVEAPGKTEAYRVASLLREMSQSVASLWASSFISLVFILVFPFLFPLMYLNFSSRQLQTSFSQKQNKLTRWCGGFLINLS